MSSYNEYNELLTDWITGRLQDICLVLKQFSIYLLSRRYTDDEKVLKVYDNYRINIDITKYIIEEIYGCKVNLTTLRGKPDEENFTRILDDQFKGNNIIKEKKNFIVEEGVYEYLYSYINTLKQLLEKNISPPEVYESLIYKVKQYDKPLEKDIMRYYVHSIISFNYNLELENEKIIKNIYLKNPDLSMGSIIRDVSDEEVFKLFDIERQFVEYEELKTEFESFGMDEELNTKFKLLYQDIYDKLRKSRLYNFINSILPHKNQLKKMKHKIILEVIDDNELTEKYNEIKEIEYDIADIEDMKIEDIEKITQNIYETIIEKDKILNKALKVLKETGRVDVIEYIKDRYLDKLTDWTLEEILKKNSERLFTSLINDKILSYEKLISKSEMVAYELLKKRIQINQEHLLKKKCKCNLYDIEFDNCFMDAIIYLLVSISDWLENEISIDEIKLALSILLPYNTSVEISEIKSDDDSKFNTYLAESLDKYKVKYDSKYFYIITETLTAIKNSIKKSRDLELAILNRIYFFTGNFRKIERTMIITSKKDDIEEQVGKPLYEFTDKRGLKDLQDYYNKNKDNLTRKELRNLNLYMKELEEKLRPKIPKNAMFKKIETPVQGKYITTADIRDRPIREESVVNRIIRNQRDYDRNGMVKLIKVNKFTPENYRIKLHSKIETADNYYRIVYLTEVDEKLPFREKLGEVIKSLTTYFKVVDDKETIIPYRNQLLIFLKDNKITEDNFVDKITEQFKFIAKVHKMLSSVLSLSGMNIARENLTIKQKEQLVVFAIDKFFEYASQKGIDLSFDRYTDKDDRKIKDEDEDEDEEEEKRLILYGEERKEKPREEPKIPLEYRQLILLHEDKMGEKKPYPIRRKRFRKDEDEKTPPKFNEEIEKRRKYFIDSFKTSFPHFVTAIVQLMYLQQMINSGRYTKKEILDWDYKNSLDINQQLVIVKEDMLAFIYNDLLKQDKTEEEIGEILEKYDSWFFVLLQRIYQKYFSPSYEVEKYNDGEKYSENHIIM